MSNFVLGKCHIFTLILQWVCHQVRVFAVNQNLSQICALKLRYYSSLLRFYSENLSWNLLTEASATHPKVSLLLSRCSHLMCSGTLFPSTQAILFHNRSKWTKVHLVHALKTPAFALSTQKIQLVPKWQADKVSIWTSKEEWLLIKYNSNEGVWTLDSRKVEDVISCFYF